MQASHLPMCHPGYEVQAFRPWAPHVLIWFEFLRHIVHVITLESQVCFISQASTASFFGHDFFSNCRTRSREAFTTGGEGHIYAWNKNRRLAQELKCFVSGNSVLSHLREIWIQWKMPALLHKSLEASPLLWRMRQLGHVPQHRGLPPFCYCTTSHLNKKECENRPSWEPGERNSSPWSSHYTYNIGGSTMRNKGHFRENTLTLLLKYKSL